MGAKVGQQSHFGAYNVGRQITILAAGYAGFEVVREINRVTSDVQFQVVSRAARREEIEFPVIELCYHNPLDVLDRKIVEEYVSKFSML
uniref:Uncharacterized protein n=1 Tax=Romanomermis culicivorax TaxID=13658 RepID=A0A915IIY7_ROMCU